MGGFEVVSQGRQWGEVARSFNLPPSVTSASYAIRQHYVRSAYITSNTYFMCLHVAVCICIHVCVCIDRDGS